MDAKWSLGSSDMNSKKNAGLTYPVQMDQWKNLAFGAPAARQTNLDRQPRLVRGDPIKAMGGGRYRAYVEFDASESQNMEGSYSTFRSG